MFKRHQRHALVAAAAVVCSAVMVSAQTPTTGASPQVPKPGGTATTQPQTSTPQASTTDRTSHTTLVGCLVREQDVPGRSPNIAERAGVLEDYILIHTNAPGSVGTAGAASPGAVGTTGSATASASANANLGPLYKVEGISDDTLKTLVGKRVEVMGELDKDDAARMPESKAASGAAGSAPQTGAAATADRSADKDDRDKKDDWMEFKAASIREVSGSCPSPSSPSNR